MLIVYFVFATVSLKHFSIGSAQNQLQALENVSISFLERVFRKHGADKLHGFLRARCDQALEGCRVTESACMGLACSPRCK